jgi:hypothetical protein
MSLGGSNCPLRVRLPASVLLLSLGLSCPAGEVELTGLVDLEACRLACVKLDGRAFTLRSGEVVSGITLVSLDAKAGWALFKDDTREMKVWLATFSSASSGSIVEAPPVVSPSSLVRLRAARGVPKPLREENNPSATPIELPRNSGDVGDLNPGMILAGASGWLAPLPSPNQPALTSGPGFSLTPRPSETPPASADNNALGHAVSPPLPQPGNVPIAAGYTLASPSQDTSTPAPLPSADPTGQPANPQPLSEGERIRLFQGTQAFLAWDIARVQGQNR